MANNNHIACVVKMPSQFQGAMIHKCKPDKMANDSNV